MDIGLDKLRQSWETTGHGQDRLPCSTITRRTSGSAVC